jgi:hypothetical protein
MLLFDVIFEKILEALFKVAEVEGGRWLKKWEIGV